MEGITWPIVWPDEPPPPQSPTVAQSSPSSPHPEPAADDAEGAQPGQEGVGFRSACQVNVGE